MELVIYAKVILTIFPCVFFQGFKAAPEAQQNVAVNVGEEVSLQCPLRHSKDVLQVMWQKILPEGEVTIATCYSFRNKLNPKFSGKIRPKQSGLQNCSIEIRNVTRQDEGCYLCLFITSADSANRGKVCLQTYEFNQPILNVTKSNSGELAVSCSATGRPAPDVRLYKEQKPLIHNNTVTVAHSNGTVTIITSALLAPLNWSKTQVCMCSVRLPFEPQWERQVIETIPDFYIEPKTTDDYTLTMALSIAMFVGGCIIVAVLVLLCKIQQKSRFQCDVEENMNKDATLDNGKTPQSKSLKKEVMVDNGKTPLHRSVNEGIESVRKRLKDDTPKTRRSARKLFNDEINN